MLPFPNTLLFINQPAQPITHTQCLDSVAQKQKLMIALHGQHHRTCLSNIAWLQLVILLVCLSNKTLLKSNANPCEHHPTPSLTCRLWRTKQHLVLRFCLQLPQHPWWRSIPGRDSRMELWCNTNHCVYKCICLLLPTKHHIIEYEIFGKRMLNKYWKQKPVPHLLCVQLKNLFESLWW